LEISNWIPTGIQLEWPLGDRYEEFALLSSSAKIVQKFSFWMKEKIRLEETVGEQIAIGLVT